jgi:hypothetical protein
VITVTTSNASNIVKTFFVKIALSRCCFPVSLGLDKAVNPAAERGQNDAKLFTLGFPPPKTIT